MNIYTDVIGKLNNPVIGWKVVSNYWVGYLLNYGPKYQEYLRTPESRDMDNNFFGNEDNDLINHIIGFTPTVTPKQRFEQITEYFSYCYEKNRQLLQLLEPKERKYVAAMTPQDAASFRKERDFREPDMSDIDEKIKEGMFRPSYAERIKENRRKKSRHFQHTVEDAADFVVSEVMGSISFSTDQCGAQVTDGNVGTAWLDSKSINYGSHVSEREMFEFMSDAAVQKALDKMYYLYEGKSAFLFDAKERNPELLTDFFFAEEDLKLISSFAS